MIRYYNNGHFNFSSINKKGLSINVTIAHDCTTLYNLKSRNYKN